MVTTSTVYRRLLREVHEPQRHSLRRLMMDEFALFKGYCYATVVANADTQQVLWVGEGRSRAAFRPFFTWLGPEGCAAIESVAMDMNTTFDLEVREHCPQAQVVYDLFHVVAKFGREVIDRVRVDQANQLRDNRTITLLTPALDTLHDQYQLTKHRPETEIVQNFRKYGKKEVQKHRFVFLPSVDTEQPGQYYSTYSITARWSSISKISGIRRRSPYQSRHTFTCWALAAGANPSFIASQLGHEDAEMVYRVYSAWLKEYDGEQVEMLNAKFNHRSTLNS